MMNIKMLHWLRKAFKNLQNPMVLPVKKAYVNSRNVGFCSFLITFLNRCNIE